MSTSAQDPRPGADDHQDDFPVPPNPVEQLRSEILKMQDCLGRMSDQCGTDLLAYAELVYLNTQLNHLARSYVAAQHIVNGIAMLAKFAKDDLAYLSEDETRELTLPASDTQAEGGAS